MMRADRPLTTRRLASAVALVTLVVVIVAGSGRRPTDSTWLGLDHLDLVFYTFIGLFALVGLIVVASTRSFRQSGTERETRRPLWPLAIMLVAALLLRPQISALLDALADQTPAGQTATIDQEEPDADAAVAERELPVAPLTDVLILVVGIVAIAAIWEWSRRRAQPANSHEDARPATEPSLMAALDQASAELLDGDDPRMAVLTAYATVEAELAHRGLARRRAETPREHLDRITRNLRINPKGLVELGGLYEVARFSAHTITAADQRRAAAALAATSAQLRSLA